MTLHSLSVIAQRALLHLPCFCMAPLEKHRQAHSLYVQLRNVLLFSCAVKRGYNRGDPGTLQVVWESQLSTADEAAMQDALLQRLAEREVGYYGKPGLSRPGAITKGAAPGMVHF